MNRLSAAASTLALCLGLVLIIGGARPARHEGVLPPAVAAVTTGPGVSATTVASPGATATAAPTIGPGYRIKIPRLEIDLPIAEGDVERDAVRQETPESFAFHLPGTALPGAGGNAYLYAHARGGMFLALWNARGSDEVVIVTPDGRQLRYVVSEVHARVDPSDVSWAAATTRERLTLQTSTGPSPGDPRFVVIAVPL